MATARSFSTAIASSAARLRRSRRLPHGERDLLETGLLGEAVVGERAPTVIVEAQVRQISQVQAAPIAARRQLARRLAAILEHESGGYLIRGEADGVRREMAFGPPVEAGHALPAADRLFQDLEHHCRQDQYALWYQPSATAVCTFGELVL